MARRVVTTAAVAAVTLWAAAAGAQAPPKGAEFGRPSCYPLEKVARQGVESFGHARMGRS